MSAPAPPPSPPARQRRPLMALRTFLLAAGTVGVFAGYLLIDSERDAVERQVEQMAGEALLLRVKHPGRYHVITDRTLAFHSQRWKVHLPPGHTYRLRLATREIPHRDGFVPAAVSAAIPAGEHVVALQYEEETAPHVRVSVDGREVIAWEEDDTWATSSASSFNAGPLHQQQDFPIDEPLQLLRFHFMIDKPGGSYPPDGAADGMLLWIERATEGKARE